ncbi:iron ABC transporter permease|uniref:Iron complex transport system permease protein n=1 Tax=Dendrosporobacter quercicolus TaxID=146817 RepID=A0A1G9Y0R5_9FIRM|nr:iron ABC transporter permease [Dendrosporobacter quercicolus]NSL49019.1 iron ABC transporter permease [Dendrosporobacter quercicolus DSM 1736]SDN02630.1 iron complex transport system permease protein [Dendrosporobacter quercicolus]
MLKQGEGRYWAVMLVMGGLVSAFCYASLSYGIIELSFADTVLTLLGLHSTGEHDVLIQQFRLPRLIIAGLAGAGLGVAGAVLQGISRNGLADPGILGINAGAGLAIVLFIFFYHGQMSGSDGLAVLLMPFFGLAGGLAAALFVYLFSWNNGRLDHQRFLLNGIALASGLSALTLYIMLKMNPADFLTATVWSMGSLLNANWQYIIVTLPWFLLLFPVLLHKADMLDLLQLEEISVRSLGISVEREQTLLLVCTTGLVSACVSVAGSIAFVGLIVPHLARRLAGIHYSRIIPLCALLGMLLVIMADFIAKNLFAPAEIAVGIIISLVGAPYFIYLLFTQKN